MNDTELQPISTETKEKIKAFQTVQNLKKVDGIVGDETWAAVEAERGRMRLDISRLRQQVTALRVMPRDGGPDAKKMALGAVAVFGIGFLLALAF